MVKQPRLKQVCVPEHAPDWYGASLDELHFEWSPEEKVQIERYCEKILKNVSVQEMTPKERFQATISGKPRDRVLIQGLPWNVYSVRTLDSYADALKPIDVYRYPKLQVQAHLATVARFDLDLAPLYQTSYGEELWGSKVAMIVYGNPCIVGDTPINKAADLEGLEVPDPKKDGLSPGYLWACRELRRIQDEYGLTKVIPLYVSHCHSPMNSMMIIVGMSKFLLALRNDPELCKRSTALATEYAIKFGRAIQDVCQADMRWVCIMPEALPLKNNEWVADFHAEQGKALGSLGPMAYGSSLARMVEWLPIFWEKGVLGPNSFCGGHYGTGDYKKFIDFSREHNLYCSCGISDQIAITGPESAIEEQVKVRCEYGKPHPKFVITSGGVDYWTPQANLDVFVALCKKHGKY